MGELHISLVIDCVRMGARGGGSGNYPSHPPRCAAAPAAAGPTVVPDLSGMKWAGGKWLAKVPLLGGRRSLRDGVSGPALSACEPSSLSVCASGSPWRSCDVPGGRRGRSAREMSRRTAWDRGLAGACLSCAGAPLRRSLLGAKGLGGRSRVLRAPPRPRELWGSAGASASIARSRRSRSATSPYHGPTYGRVAPANRGRGQRWIALVGVSGGPLHTNALSVF